MAIHSVTYLQRVFRALGNKRRLATIRFLAERGEMPAGAIAKLLKLSFSATSRHLKTLESIDLVETRQEGLTVNYRIVRQLSAGAREIVDLAIRARA